MLCCKPKICQQVADLWPLWMHVGLDQNLQNDSSVSTNFWMELHGLHRKKIIQLGSATDLQTASPKVWNWIKVKLYDTVVPDMTFLNLARVDLILVAMTNRAQSGYAIHGNCLNNFWHLQRIEYMTSLILSLKPAYINTLYRLQFMTKCAVISQH